MVKKSDAYVFLSFSVQYGKARRFRVSPGSTFHGVSEYTGPHVCSPHPGSHLLKTCPDLRRSQSFHLDDRPEESVIFLSPTIRVASEDGSDVRILETLLTSHALIVGGGRGQSNAFVSR